MVRVKICGITSIRDALACIEAGADALGFVFWAKSQRHVTPEAAGRITAALPPFAARVGVFVNETPEAVAAAVREASLTAVQLHGDESPDACAETKKLSGVPAIKVFRVKSPRDIMGLENYNASAFLLDTFKKGLPGGTGETFDWEIAAKAARDNTVILSGGLTPENVGEAVRLVRPYAVDVSSGVERSPGVKDPELVIRFIKEARAALC